MPKKKICLKLCRVIFLKYVCLNFCNRQKYLLKFVKIFDIFKFLIKMRGDCKNWIFLFPFFNTIFYSNLRERYWFYEIVWFQVKSKTHRRSLEILNFRLLLSTAQWKAFVLVDRDFFGEQHLLLHNW